MASHQCGKNKLNMRSDERRSLIRNQAASFIKFGHLQSTRARVKVVQQFVEKLVTVARKGQDFTVIRKIKQALPYDDKVVKKLVYDLAPKYVGRPGGYTRVFLMGTRASDTAKVARLEWVEGTANSAPAEAEASSSE